MCRWTTNPMQTLWYICDTKIRHYQFKNKSVFHGFSSFSFMRIQMFWSDSSEKGLEKSEDQCSLWLRVMSFKQTDAVGLYVTKCYCHMSLTVTLAPAVSSQQQHSKHFQNLVFTRWKVWLTLDLIKNKTFTNKSNLFKGQSSIFLTNCNTSDWIRVRKTQETIS